MVKIVFADVKCCDCGGAVDVFVIPDNVWDGLGFAPEAFACLACVAKRLNPDNPPDAELPQKTPSLLGRGTKFTRVEQKLRGKSPAKSKLPKIALPQ